jgi:two-component system, chemotaxis family, chemotaxis protein CheY
MKRCMIVDGSSVIRKVARRILEGPEMTVVDAGLGEEALSMCMTHMPDVIVVESFLPDMDAVEFISRVTAMAHDRKPHVVLCMSQLEVATFMRAKRAGAKGYVLKPFNRPQLLERFREMDIAA